MHSWGSLTVTFCYSPIFIVALRQQSGAAEWHYSSIGRIHQQKDIFSPHLTRREQKRSRSYQCHHPTEPFQKRLPWAVHEQGKKKSLSLPLAGPLEFPSVAMPSLLFLSLSIHPHSLSHTHTRFCMAVSLRTHTCIDWHSSELRWSWLFASPGLS